MPGYVGGIRGLPLLGSETSPEISEVEKFFAGIYEDAPPQKRPVPTTTTGGAPIYVPIQEEEILGAIKGWKNSAPGPDGITVSQVKRCPTRHLQVIFNALMYRRLSPQIFRASRTILLPKDGDRKEPSKWKPVSISSAVQLLFHRVLARRITNSVNLHPLQRGFVEIDGTLANTIILDTYIKSRRIQGKPFNILSLDVTKAFDSVTHQAIFHALRRFDVPQPIVDYLAAAFHSSYTTTSTGG